MSLNTNTIEAFLEAMNIIAKKNVDEVSYDTTIECQIVDNSEAKKTGRYVVSNGVSKFDAYSEKTSYLKDAWVRVLIPGGDYSKTKYIEGPVSADEKNQSITYLSAINTILDIVDLVKINNAQLKNPIGLTANGDKKSVVIFDFNIDENLWLNDLYSSLFIEADFKSLLNQSNIISGNYGVKITVFVKINDSIIRPKEFYFDSQEFFGNPYKFSIYSNQAKVFDIKNYKTITRIKLEMYQDDNFYFWTGDTGEKLSSENNLPNLFINNIRLGFGTGLTDVQDNTVKLICKDPGEFSYKDLTQNSKDLEFLWYNKSEENKYIGFSDGIAGWEVSPIFPEDQTAGIENNDTTTYDEIEFLELEEENLKLISQQSTEVPVDKDSLQFSLDIEEISNSLNEIKSILNNKYIGTLKSLKNSLIGLETVQEDLDEIIEKINNMISKELNVLINGGKYITDEAMEFDLTSFLNYYKNLLAYVAFIYNSYETEPANDLLEIIRQFPADSLIAPNEEQSNQYFQILFNLIKNWNEQIIVLENLKNLLKKNYKNYYRYLEKYSFQITEICSVIKTRILNILNRYPSSITTEDSGLEFKREKSGDEIVLNISLCRLIIEENDTLKTLEDKIKENKIGEKPILSYSNYDSQQRIVWKPKDLSVFDNLYCIYWYQYEKDYMNENDPFGQLHWKKIDKWYTEYKLEDIVDVNSGETVKVYQGVGEQETIQPNVGLPSRNEESKDGIYYWNTKTQISDNNSMLSIILNPQKQEEKFKVVLIYNHEVYESNEIIFTNSTHPNNLDNQNVNVLEIENITNSQNNYLLYDGTTKLLLDSLQANLDREIKAIYKGNQDVETVWEDGYISWYCPVNQTQLDYDISLLESKGFLCNSFLTIKDMGTYIYNPTFEIINKDDEVEIFKSDLDYSYEIVSNENENYYKIIDIDNNRREILIPTNGIKKIKYQPIQDENSKYNGLVCFSKVIEDINTDLSFFYKIKNTFQETNFNNTIICVITKNENEYENSKEFTFNAFGSNGTDYTIVITPKDWDKVAFVNDNIPFDLEVKVFDKDGKDVSFSGMSVEWVGPTVYEEEIMSENIISIVKGKKDYTIDLSDDTNLSVGETYSYTNENNETISGTVNLSDLEKNEIDLNKENLTVSSFLEKVFKNVGTIFKSIAVLAAQENTRNYGILNIKIPGIVEGITLETNYAIPWASSIDYRFNGASSVIYNSQGTNPVYIRNPYKLFDKNNELEGLKWEIVYYDSQLEKIDTENFIHYRVTIENDILKPNSLFIGNIPIYPVVQCSQNGYILWQQPLIIMQNQYESTLLNKWDGSQVVDKDGNYILTAMVGAGVKNSDNSFSGVLMGDMRKNGDSGALSKTGIGLYGFHRGGQSFGFNIDGTAFLGKSGFGRIEFDGNYGLIRSASWNGKVDSFGNIIKSSEKGGMAISLEEGRIDAHNFKLTGGDSLYLNSNPDDYYFKINHKDNHLQFTKDGALQINVEGDNSYFNAKNFTLDVDSDIDLILNINTEYWSSAIGNFDKPYSSIDYQVEANVCLEIGVGKVNYSNCNSVYGGGWSFVPENWKTFLEKIKNSNDNDTMAHTKKIWKSIHGTDLPTDVLTAENKITENGWKVITSTVYNIVNWENNIIDSSDSRIILRLASELSDLSAKYLKIKFDKTGLFIYKYLTESNGIKNIRNIFEVSTTGVSAFMNNISLSNEICGEALPSSNDTGMVFKDGTLFFLLEETE